MVALRAAKLSFPMRFKGGSCVWHQNYGEGLVVIRRLSGGLEHLDVLSPDSVGPKTIIANFLRSTEIR